MHAACAVQHRKLYHTGTQLASRSLVVSTLKNPAGPYCFSTCRCKDGRLMSNCATHAAASAECIQLHAQASTPTEHMHLCALPKKFRMAALPSAIHTNTARARTVQVQIRFPAAIPTNTARTRTVQVQIRFPAAIPTNTARAGAEQVQIRFPAAIHRNTTRA